MKMKSFFLFSPERTLVAASAAAVVDALLLSQQKLITSKQARKEASKSLRK